MLTLHQPQSPICISSKVFHLGVLSFVSMLLLEKVVLNLIQQHWPHLTKDPSQEISVSFNSYLSRSGPRVLLAAWQAGSTRIPHIWIGITKRQCCAMERADLGAPRPEETWRVQRCADGSGGMRGWGISVPYSKSFKSLQANSHLSLRVS